MNERLCADCGKVFTVGRDQAARYAAKGWKPPRRCPACRTARRKPHVDPADPVDAPAEAPTRPPRKEQAQAAQLAPAKDPTTSSSALRSSSSSDFDFDPEDPPDVPPEAPGPTEPEVKAPFEVQCAACGTLTRVAFRPTGKRPVYCRPCFELR